MEPMVHHLTPDQNSGCGTSVAQYLQTVRWCAQSLEPALSSCITCTRQAREPETLLQWLDLWQPLMPPAMLHELLTSQVFPKVGTTECKQQCSA